MAANMAGDGMLAAVEAATGGADGRMRLAEGVLVYMAGQGMFGAMAPPAIFAGAQMVGAVDHLAGDAAIRAGGAKELTILRAALGILQAGGAATG